VDGQPDRHPRAAMHVVAQLIAAVAAAALVKYLASFDGR